mgnify:FL=1
MQFSQSLKQNSQFRRLYRQGKTAADRYLALYCRKNRLACNRLGYTVSGKLGHAVVRNRVRRRLRECYRIHESAFSPGWDIVVVARHRAVDAAYSDLEASFLALSDKLGLLRKDPA